MLDDRILQKSIAQASEQILSSLPQEEHIFSPASEARAERLVRKYKWFEWRQTAKQPAKRMAAVAMALLVFGFSGTMTVQANRRRAVETIVRIFEHYISSEEGETAPPENPAIYTIEFGWLPDRMYEAERIEAEDFYYILFRTKDPDYPLENDYAAFFLKKLPPTGSDKIHGSSLTMEDLEQEAVTHGAPELEAILADRHNCEGTCTTRAAEDGAGERYMIYIRTNVEAELSQGGGVARRIYESLIVRGEEEHNEP